MLLNASKHYSVADPENSVVGGEYGIRLPIVWEGAVPHLDQPVLLHKLTEICIQFTFRSGAYLGEIAPMANAEIAPLYKHMTPKSFITINSAKRIMIMQLIVAKYYYT